MKTLYLECRMGAAGDMLMGALSELVDQKAFVDKMNSLGIKGLKVQAGPSVKCGIQGTHMSVIVDGQEEKSADVSADQQAEKARFRYRIENLDEEEMAHILAHIQEIQGIDQVEWKDGQLSYLYNHDEAEKAVNQIREILMDHAPKAQLISLGHEHTSHSATGHVHLADVYGWIDHLPVSEQVRKDAREVYESIAEAESRAHGMPVDQIHFHEVGTLDALADVVGCCILMEMIQPDEVIASPVAVGNGMVRCAHGILPVPAPATAYLLRGIPTYSGNMQGELCTPTGAALLKHFAHEFRNQPVMVTEKIGYGMGTKDFPAANCLRAFLGESDEQTEVSELVCNLDDITAEEAGHAMDVLLAQGALDVYMIPAQMKKNRPGLLFTCMCRKQDTDKMVRLMFQNLTTIGIRQYDSSRRKLNRSIRTVQTSLGPVRVKRSEGYGVQREKLEYDDLVRIAQENNISVLEAKKEITKEMNRS